MPVLRRCDLRTLSQITGFPYWTWWLPGVMILHAAAVHAGHGSQQYKGCAKSNAVQSGPSILCKNCCISEQLLLVEVNNGHLQRQSGARLCPAGA